MRRVMTVVLPVPAPATMSERARVVDDGAALRVVQAVEAARHAADYTMGSRDAASARTSVAEASRERAAAAYVPGLVLYSRRPMTEDTPGPTSHTYFSQRLRLHYVDWGNRDKPPAADDPRRARPLPQLGLDGGGAARRLARHRAGPARAWRQPVVAGRQLHDGRLHLRSRAARSTSNSWRP